MPKKPCVLNEYEKDYDQVINENISLDNENYCSEDDVIVLEDEFGRITLFFSDMVTVYPKYTISNSEIIHELVTGGVVAVQGICNDTGILNVQTIYCPDISGITSNKIQKQDAVIDTKIDNDTTIAIVSSPCISDLSSSTTQAFSTLLDMLQGCSLPSSYINDIPFKKLSHLYIIGPLVQSTGATTKAEATITKTNGTNDARISKQYEQFQLLDSLVSFAASTVPISILPSNLDPTNFMFPQLPIHSCLLPISSSMSTCSLDTNPL